MKSTQGATKQDLIEFEEWLEKRFTSHTEALAQEMLGALQTQFEIRDEKIGGRFDGIEARLTRIENKLDATIDRVDDHAVEIRHLKQQAA